MWGGGGGGYGAGLVAADPARADAARAAPRPSDLAGGGRGLRPAAVRAHGPRGPRHARRVRARQSRHARGPQVVLQERWEEALRERKRLSPRSVVPVLDALLAADWADPAKIG